MVHVKNGLGKLRMHRLPPMDPVVYGSQTHHYFAVELHCNGCLYHKVVPADFNIRLSAQWDLFAGFKKCQCSKFNSHVSIIVDKFSS